MKILNRSNSNKEIQWLGKSSLEKDLEKKVLRIKNLVLTKGSKAFDEINQELNLISPRSYKVKISEIIRYKFYRHIIEALNHSFDIQLK